MNQDHRPEPDTNRILVAELTGIARHRARWRELARDEQDAAATELREFAGGRADLPAEVAGIFEGASDGEPGEPLARQAAHLCRLAGTDETLIRRGERRTPFRLSRRVAEGMGAGVRNRFARVLNPWLVASESPSGA
jgi:hypothetical protein